MTQIALLLPQLKLNRRRGRCTHRTVFFESRVYTASMQNILFSENNKQSERNLQTGLQRE